MPNTSGSPSQNATVEATYAQLSAYPADQFKTGDEAWCTQGEGTSDGPIYVLLRAEEYGVLPVLPSPTALPVLGQSSAQAIWVSLAYLLGLSLIPPLLDTYFVARNGPATSPPADGSIARPYRTIQAAINAVPNFSAIMIASGVYVEALVLPDSKSLELFGFGSVIISSQNAPAVQYIATAAGGNIRIGLYHLSLITTHLDVGTTPTCEIDFLALVNTSGQVTMNDVSLTRTANVNTGVALRLSKAARALLINVRVERSTAPLAFNPATAFVNMARMDIEDCRFGPVDFLYTAGLNLPPATFGKLAYFASCLLTSRGGPFPVATQSLTLLGAPQVEFDEDCVLDGSIDTTWTATEGGQAPSIAFHGKAGNRFSGSTIGIPDTPAAVVNLDRANFIGSILVQKPATTTGAARVNARQMIVQDAGSFLVLGANVIVDFRGSTGPISAPGVAATSSCDRDRCRVRQVAAPAPTLPAVATVVYEDDGGNPLPFPATVTPADDLQITYEVAVVGFPVAAGAIPIAVGAKTLTGFDYGANAADAAKVAEVLFLVTRLRSP